MLRSGYRSITMFQEKCNQWKTILPQQVVVDVVPKETKSVVTRREGAFGVAVGNVQVSHAGHLVSEEHTKVTFVVKVRAAIPPPHAKDNDQWVHDWIDPQVAPREYVSKSEAESLAHEYRTQKGRIVIKMSPSGNILESGLLDTQNTPSFIW
jgi:hypothetical protein